MANSIKIGGFSFDALKIGNGDVDAAYLGDTLVYSASTHTHDYSQDYLTFTASESGTFKFNGNSINYSLDSGNTWDTLASNTDSPIVTSGSKILWKLSGVTPSELSSIGSFSSSGNFTVEGNIMSLCYGDNFNGQTTIPSGMFYLIFYECTKLTSAENLVLPSRTLSDACYAAMFMDCTNLTTAPKLPATTLAQHCYQSMFYGCTSLNSLTCLATDISANSCTSNWVNGVASSGTFTKAANMNDWSSGADGIPSNWTVVDYSGGTTFTSISSGDSLSSLTASSIRVSTAVTLSESHNVTFGNVSTNTYTLLYENGNWYNWQIMIGGSYDGRKTLLTPSNGYYTIQCDNVYPCLGADGDVYGQGGVMYATFDFEISN